MSTTVEPPVPAPDAPPPILPDRHAGRGLAGGREHVASDPISAALAQIVAANRVLANRVAEVERELEHQQAVAEHLRQRLAGSMHDSLFALSAEAAASVEELTALRATKLLRWSARPRRVYGWLRRHRRSGR